MQDIFNTTSIKSLSELSLRCGAAVRTATNLFLGLLLDVRRDFAERIVYMEQMTDELTASSCQHALPLVPGVSKIFSPFASLMYCFFGYSICNYSP